MGLLPSLSGVDHVTKANVVVMLLTARLRGALGAERDSVVNERLPPSEYPTPLSAHT
jgi:hypothetical protein